MSVQAPAMSCQPCSTTTPSDQQPLDAFWRGSPSVPGWRLSKGRLQLPFQQTFRR